MLQAKQKNSQSYLIHQTLRAGCQAGGVAVTHARSLASRGSWFISRYNPAGIERSCPLLGRLHIIGCV